MPVEFSRSLRSLNRDGFGRSLSVMGIAGLLLAGWSAWFLFARVPRYEVTERARLEVDRALYQIQAPVAGRVVRSNLALGREVAAGEVLLEIETEAQQLRLAEEQSRLGALAPQIKTLLEEVAAQEEAARAERQAAAAALDQARAQQREAESLRALADQEAERFARLHAAGLVPERDYARATSEAQSRRAAAEASAFSAVRLEREHRKAGSERDAHIKQLRSEITRLEGERGSRMKTMDALQYEVARRRIPAPVAGRLGEVAVLRAGGFVQEGEKLGAVVPRGELRVVAEFLPPAALGRIQAGQPAWLRLEGFPWTQYGAIAATVESVGSEVREGRVRVELRVKDPVNASIPLQHGLPGSVEVQVESAAPAVLALRAAGQLLARPRSPYR